MANFFFEDMTADQALAFTSADRLIFNTAGLTAAQVSVSFIPFTVNTPDYIVISAPFKALQFNDTGAFRGQTGSQSSVFSDGSLLYIGTTNDDGPITGTAGADGLYGSVGSDTLDGASGNDVLQGN